MSYVIGAAAGLIFGGIIGQLKNLFIWQAYLRKSAAPSDRDTGGSYMEPGSLGGLYARSLISYAVNIATLFAAFFVRNKVPFNGIAFLIGTAIALTVMNKVLAVQQKKSEEKEKEKGKETGGS